MSLIRLPGYGISGHRAGMIDMKALSSAQHASHWTPQPQGSSTRDTTGHVSVTSDDPSESGLQLSPVFMSLTFALHSACLDKIASSGANHGPPLRVSWRGSFKRRMEYVHPPYGEP